jgi:hypothetical protein
LFVITTTCFARSPILAGIAMGLLTYKPNIAWLPIALAILQLRLRMLASAAITVVCTAILSILFFGFGTWVSFFREAIVQTGTLEEGALRAHQVTPFMVARMVTDNLSMCYLVAILVATFALFAVYRVWRHTESPFLRNLSLAAAIPIATPYANNYDLAILTLPFVIACQQLLAEDRPKWNSIILVAILSLLPLMNSPYWFEVAPFPLTSIALIGLVSAAWWASVRGDRWKSAIRA